MTPKKTETKIVIPTKECTDIKCPFHGKLKTHGRIFVGTVIKEAFHKTAKIEFERRFFLPKYERFEKRRTRITAHVPPCMEISKNDIVKIAETRPLSKTKNFVVIGIVKK